MPLVFAAYCLWGLFPLYFPLLEPASATEILAHRFVWTFVLMGLLIGTRGQWRQLRTASARTWVSLVAAAIFISANWGVYVYTVNTDRVSEAALGYFINPLVAVLLGVFFLGERLNRAQLVAVVLAAIAVVVMTIDVGTPPLLGLTLAISFGVYGLLKKQVQLSSAVSLSAETAIITPIALVYLWWLSANGTSTFTEYGWQHTALLMSAGVATSLPLLLFGAGAKSVPMMTIGMLQYFTPTVQMLIAVFINGEHITAGRWVGFIIIWVAVAISVADMATRAGRARRQRRRHRMHPATAASASAS
ncbi:EamA family transporter RarD [Corynebacterium sp. TAE3-ERU12]|uniref:EamA family transporter RarD n=1 Tax=Corynebacterium sp. TAE3-ERU12 TaxID=2849491 RepID=UPI001C457B28|nr:EamA family transporter RarD [Corynebacterium sp. TAE3-ERU12]